MAELAQARLSGVAGLVVANADDVGILTERTGRKTNRIYSYERYVTLLTR